jgi:chemosensory pili system protein ChpA (sensor histidine kinase/response regulator)
VAAASNLRAEDRTPVFVDYLLVVDDSATSRTALVELLSEDGIHAVGVGDGAEALAFLKGVRRCPRAVLTDLMMPEVDGWELVKQMKADAHLATVPIIVMTASPFARSPLGLPLLRKPFRVQELYAVLGPILGSIRAAE